MVEHVPSKFYYETQSHMPLVENLHAHCLAICSDDRVDAYWPSGHSDYGHLVSNDGLNADYLREPSMGSDEHVVDNRQENPYGW
jgi:hypothetical protein